MLRRFRDLRRCGLPWCFSLLSVAWLLPAEPAVAATLVTISGTIRAEPRCELNKNQSIRVDFGDAVKIAAIDGRHFKRNVSFSIECKYMKVNTVKLKIMGVGADFKPAALTTSVPGLGLDFFVNDASTAVNTWFSVDYLNLPRVEVAPVKAPYTKLPDGLFTARAVMVVAFE